MTQKSVIVLGAGGHAKVLLDILLEQGVNVLGIADKTEVNIGMLSGLYGISVIGNDADVLSHSPEEIELVNGIGSIGTMGMRRSIYNKFKEQGCSFRQVIHPTAIISKRTELAEGCR